MTIFEVLIKRQSCKRLAINAYRILSYTESRTPKQRGQNTINDVFTKLRTLFKWAEDQELSRTNPFKHFKVKECVYGPPIYITVDERKKVYSTDFSFDPALENQSHARSMRCCHPILQERPLPAICTKMSRT